MAEGYSERTLDYYESSDHRRLLPQPSADVTRTNPVCGDSLRLTLDIAEGNVAATGFEASGCVAATAAAAALCQLAEGQPLSRAAEIDPAQIEAELGGLPPGRAHGALLAAETLAAALEQLDVNPSEPSQ